MRRAVSRSPSPRRRSHAGNTRACRAAPPQGASSAPDGVKNDPAALEKWVKETAEVVAADGGGDVDVSVLYRRMDECLEKEEYAAATMKKTTKKTTKTRCFDDVLQKQRATFLRLIVIVSRYVLSRRERRRRAREREDERRDNAAL